MSSGAQPRRTRAILWVSLVALVALALVAIGVVVASLGSSSSPAPSGEPPGGLSPLAVSGQVIRDGSGQGDIVDLRGTNLGGWLLQEGWMSPAGDAPLDRAAWTASANAAREGSSPADALDGDPSTFWWSGRNQQPGDRFVVDLGSPTTFDTVTLDSAPPGDAPSAFVVQVSTDGVTWEDVATGSGAAASISVSSGARTTRYLSIVLTAAADRWWSLGEVTASISDDFHTRSLLADRFGDDGAQELLAAYQNAWIDESDLDEIAALGLNVVRVPLSWQHLMHDDGAMRPDAEAFERIDWVVEESARRGMYVILDMHGTPGAHCPWQSCGLAGSNRLWVDETFQSWTADLWRRIAERYRGNPAVAAYDLLNEPLTTGGEKESGDQLRQKFDYYDRLYDVTRAADPDRIVMMAAFPSFDDAIAPAEYGWTNVVYQTHHYAFGAVGDSAAMRAFIDGELAQLTTHRATWGVPVYAGEYWFGNDPDLYRRWFAGLEAIHASWTNWTYKHRAGGGPPDALGASTGDKWSFFYASSARVPDIAGDSFESIRDAWAGFATASFVPDRDLMALYRSAAAAPTAVAVPGFIEAERFAAGVGVMIEPTTDAGGGWSAAGLDPGDTLSYELDAPAEGEYDLTFRVTGVDGASPGFSVEAGEASALVDVPATGDEQPWSEVTARVSLEQGRQSLTVHVEAGEWSLNWLRVSRADAR